MEAARCSAAWYSDLQSVTGNVSDATLVFVIKSPVDGLGQQVIYSGLGCLKSFLPEELVSDAAFGDGFGPAQGDGLSLTGLFSSWLLFPINLVD